MTDADPASPAPPPPVSTQAPLMPAAPVRRSSPLTWAVSLSLAALAGALLFVGGYLAAGAGDAAACAAPTEEFAAFCEAYDRIQEQFVDDPAEEELVEGAIEGMFEGLGDPFSGYMSPDDYLRAQEDLSGQFSGIGAEMGVKNVQDPEDLDACDSFSDVCVLVVISPLEGSPAEAAGLQPGDVVIGVDGASVSGMDLDDAIQRVRGEAGTDVTLTIRRGDGDPFDVTITRDQIQMREVTSEVLGGGRVGYVALHGFSRAAADQLHVAIGDLLDAGVESLVFDLRNNPGGYIEVANQVASEFIGDGLVFIQESSGDEVKQWTATDEGLATNPELPVVVLVNGGSASASEIVAAALKERERATIVGQPTYGKDTVQVWTELENGGGVRITVSRWFTPEHNSVAPDGVQPDELVEIPDGTPPEQDLFVERAVELLTQRLLVEDGASSAPAAEGPSVSTTLVPLGAPISYDPGGLLQAVA